MEHLFSYGTLRDENVQRSIFGHTLSGRADAIVGHRLCPVAITDQRAIAISGIAVHTILERTGRDSDEVEGMVFQLSAEDLRLADAYEDAAYERARIRLRSGAEAWVYVRA